MEYGTQIATAAPAGCLAASFNAMGNRLLAERLPALLPIKNQAAHVHTRSQDASFVLQCVRNQDIYRAAELCAADSTAGQSTKQPGCLSTLR